MGYGFGVKCSNCGFVKHFSIGIGFYHSSLERICEGVHYSLRRKIKSITDNHKVKDYDFDRLLVRCPRCKTLSVKDFIRIEYDEGVYQSSLTCGKCKKNLEILDESTSFDSIECPQCGEKALIKTDELDWD